MQLKDIGSQVSYLIKGTTLAIVTDENVNRLYEETVKASLVSAGFQVETYVVKPGEDSKSGETYLALLNFLAEIPLTRADGIIALGGGVVGDLAGFAAATFLRGIKVVQVPTTLLAAVDSSVGGKTAINLPAGKNLAGAFHQPALVWCDSSTLKTLPEDILRDGMAEVIKYGILEDKTFFEKLEDKEYTYSHMDEIIERCVVIKKRYVEEDEYDTGVRQLLNLGHTVAHAIEKLSDFQVSHGSAVAKGTLVIAKLANSQGWCDEACVRGIEEILQTYGFDLSINYEMTEIYDILKTDKKRKGNDIDIVVPEKIGKCRLQRLTIDELGEMLCSL